MPEFIPIRTETDRINEEINYFASTGLTDLEFIDIQVKEFLAPAAKEEEPTKRQKMLLAQEYYENKNAILSRKRYRYNESGDKIEEVNLANNKLVHNYIKKLTNQKVNYLMSKPFKVSCNENKEYEKVLNTFFDDKRRRHIQRLAKSAVLNGIAWAYMYLNSRGELRYKVMKTEEMIPIWNDADHTELDAMIRTYCITKYEGKNTKKSIRKVEWYSEDGVSCYEYDDEGHLISDVSTEVIAYVTEKEEQEDGTIAENKYNWLKVPFIWFKYNDEETGLLDDIKSLIDNVDKSVSDNANMLEDMPQATYVVKNYAGTSAAEYRRNVSLYGVVFVDKDGAVDTVKLDINVELFKTHYELLRKAIYEFGRGVDNQDLQRIGNAPSGEALKFMYADLDMDCNEIEVQFKASLQEMLWYINVYLSNSPMSEELEDIETNYDDYRVEFTFNRNIIINESETITNLKSSEGLISEKTRVAKHPYVTNADEEIKQKEKEEKKAADKYSGYGNTKIVTNKELNNANNANNLDNKVN